MPMASRLVVETVKDVTLVTFTDASVVDAQHIENIRDELYGLVEKQARRRIVLDLSKVQHFSSAALGVLIPLADKVRKIKGELILCSLKPEIRKVFKITGLEKQFRFADSEKEALSALGVSGVA